MCWRLMNAVFASLVISVVVVAEAATIISAEYFPLTDGNTWTYSVDGFSIQAIVLPGTMPINGVATKGLQDSDGEIDYFTSDENGIRQHGDFDPSPPASTATFNPPVVYVQGVTDISDVVNSSGTVSLSIPSVSATPFVYNYTDTAVVEAFETVTVPAGTFKTLRVRDTLHVFGTSQGVPLDETFVETDWLARFIGTVKGIVASSDGTATFVLTNTNVIPPIFSSILPSSRSVQVNTPATAFATIVNPSGATATGCSIIPVTSLPAEFLYQTTDPLTNALTGTPNTPATIAPEGSQSFVIAFTPTVAFSPTEVELQFDCTNTDVAPTFVGVNTLLLSASDTPIPDIVALAATQSGDGIVNIDGIPGTGAFAVAVANVGATGTITASVDTGRVILPVSVSMCKTNPATGLCISPVQESVVTTIDSNETAAFAIFLSGSGNVPFDPANNRVFVRFKDAGGDTRGSTSVAVRTL
jgi:hypothetical protein